MTAQLLLDRLEGVRQRADGSWIAKCPAHHDRSPSLSVREADDGVVLLRCFAGCLVQSIVETVGLSMTDLYPPRPTEAHGHQPRKRPPILSGDVLRALQLDLLVIAQAARLIATRGLSAEELASLTKSVDHMIDLIEAVQNG